MEVNHSNSIPIAEKALVSENYRGIFVERVLRDSTQENVRGDFCAGSTPRSRLEILTEDSSRGSWEANGRFLRISSEEISSSDFYPDATRTIALHPSREWAMNVHETSAAMFYLMAKRRGERGDDPDGEHRAHRGFPVLQNEELNYLLRWVLIRVWMSGALQASSRFIVGIVPLQTLHTLSYECSRDGER